MVDFMDLNSVVLIIIRYRNSDNDWKHYDSYYTFFKKRWNIVSLVKTENDIQDEGYPFVSCHSKNELNEIFEFWKKSV